MVGLVLLTWFLGSLGFSVLEGWTYFEAMYFTFGTLLTIGYGDYFPQTFQGQFFLRWYIFIGLACVAFVLNLFGDFTTKVSSRIISRGNSK